MEVAMALAKFNKVILENWQVYCDAKNVEARFSYSVPLAALVWGFIGGFIAGGVMYFVNPASILSTALIVAPMYAIAGGFGRWDNIRNRETEMGGMSKQDASHVLKDERTIRLVELMMWSLAHEKALLAGFEYFNLKTLKGEHTLGQNGYLTRFGEKITERASLLEAAFEEHGPLGTRLPAKLLGKRSPQLLQDSAEARIERGRGARQLKGAVRLE
jgi:hypothetical protein